MSSSDQLRPNRSDEIDVIASVMVMWRHKLLIGLVAAIFGLVATYLALTATLIYRAEVVVTEARDTTAGNAGLLSGQLGGLANLAGLGGGIAATSAGREAQAVLASNHLAELFITRNGLLPELTKGKKQASLWLAVSRFREKILSIAHEKTTGTTTVAIEWTDPATAAQWANGYVALANELVRNRALNESTRKIDYLNKQVEKTTVVEIQRVMYNLIESETKMLMLANARTEYAFTIVDPAVKPEMRISPRRALMVASGIVLGGLFGTALVFALNAVRRYRRETRSAVGDRE